MIDRTQSIRLLDEPEAFLHPPQARLIGQLISGERSADTQMFVATHSTDVLDGLIDAGSDRVRVVRIRRVGNVNTVSELSREKLKRVVTDTFARHSRVFDGIFYDHVVVCESDADCMFYQAFINLPEISGEHLPDMLFVHTSGKHRIAKFVDTLRSLSVPVSVIADFDILREEVVFSNLFTTMGGNWQSLKPKWKAFSQEISLQKTSISAGQMKEQIIAEVSRIPNDAASLIEFERAAKRLFKNVTPWETLKSSGRAGLKSAALVQQFDKLQEVASSVGIWIVPVGELEGFCRSTGQHGPAFVEQVLTNKNLGTDDELHEARSFVKKVWMRTTQSYPPDATI